MTVRHLGINAVFLQPGVGGLATYVRELVGALRRTRPALEITIFTSRAGVAELAGETWAGEVTFVTHRAFGRRGLTALSELVLLGRIAQRRGVDVLHSVALTGPLRSPVPHLDLIADVTWMRHDDSVDPITRQVWRTFVPPVARHADRILAISQAAADELGAALGIPAERIDVTPLGPGAPSGAAPTPEAELRARFALGDGPLVLCVSNKRPHKNVARLIRAFAVVRKTVPDAVLALPGSSGGHEQQLRELAAQLGLGDAVVFPPYVDAADLEGFYAAATCFAFPSLAEGFGLPVLEAMLRGVPVVCSNTTSLPEVAGDAALLVDPEDVEAIADAVACVLGDAALRSILVAKGHAQAARFTWERTAELTLAAYELTVAQRRGSVAFER